MVAEKPKLIILDTLPGAPVPIGTETDISGWHVQVFDRTRVAHAHLTSDVRAFIMPQMLSRNSVTRHEERSIVEEVRERRNIAMGFLSHLTVLQRACPHLESKTLLDPEPRHLFVPTLEGWLSSLAVSPMTAPASHLELVRAAA